MEAAEEIYRRAAAFDNRILHGLVGSTVHGLELAGQDDRDEMGCSSSRGGFTHDARPPP